MDNPELVDLFESELDMLANKAHNSGLSWWWILRVVLTQVTLLVIQADSEYWMKGGK